MTNSFDGEIKKNVIESEKINNLEPGLKFQLKDFFW